MRTDEVYRQMRADIVSARLEPGTPLVETALADRYGSSRTPVRESLARLEHDGLVVRTNRGMQIRQVTPEEIVTIYELRILLEGFAARAAAERRTDLDLVRLGALHDEERAHGDATPQAWAERNHAFHEALWEAAHNPLLIELITRLNVQLVGYPSTTLGYPGRWEAALEQHRRIIEAVRERDPDRAERETAEHMRDARDVRLRMWKEELGGARPDAEQDA